MARKRTSKMWSGTITSAHSLISFLTNQTFLTTHGGFEALYLEPMDGSDGFLIEIIFNHTVTDALLAMNVKGNWQPEDDIRKSDIRIFGDMEEDGASDSDDSTQEVTMIEDEAKESKKSRS